MVAKHNQTADIGLRDETFFNAFARHYGPSGRSTNKCADNGEDLCRCSVVEVVDLSFHGSPDLLLTWVVIRIVFDQVEVVRLSEAELGGPRAVAAL